MSSRHVIGLLGSKKSQNGYGLRCRQQRLATTTHRCGRECGWGRGRAGDSRAGPGAMSMLGPPSGGMGRGRNEAETRRDGPCTGWRAPSSPVERLLTRVAARAVANAGFVVLGASTVAARIPTDRRIVASRRLPRTTGPGRSRSSAPAGARPVAGRARPPGCR